MAALLEGEHESIDESEFETPEPRTVRALTQAIAVYEKETDLYAVFSETGTEYTVDADTGSCTCPDFQKREPEGGCKHLRRVAFWRDDEAIPSWVDLSAVNSHLTKHLGLYGEGR